MKTILSVGWALACCSLGAVEIDLAGEWTLVQGVLRPGLRACMPLSGEIPCTVPGGVHSALLRAGKIEDVFYGTNEVNSLWIAGDAQQTWELSRTFTVDASVTSMREQVLRLEDCDTFAKIFVNGRAVGETTDRFQRYTFPLTGLLKAGENTIKAVFRSPEGEALRRRQLIGRAFPMDNVIWAKNQALVRKPACHAGWDWGASLQVTGLCGPVRILASNKPRIDYVYTTQDFNDDLSHCTLTVFADLSDGTTVTNRAEIDNPPLWWPNGAGPQRFYEYDVTVQGEKVCGRIGLRKLEVLNEKTLSADGKDELSLVFRVNNRRLFMKGANWIPCDGYENRQTPERYRDLLTSARNANMNMIRVWGGGQYEKDAFYDTCDELGILIWHDMMHSCAVYPADKWFLDEIRAELSHQLRRLRDHASIAIWCGDNECLGATKWFEESRRELPYYVDCWKKRSKLQEELVRRYDPARTYWPSSPCCGPGDFGDGWKTDSKGDMHNWEVWHQNREFTAYYNYTPRFCSEFGYQSFPSLEVAETFASREQIFGRGPDFEWHQKNRGGNRRIRETMLRYFKAPKDVPSELLLSQFQQAMAIRMAVDAWRAQRPRCMGTLFWQLNDNWPVASWSSIEYTGKWKPLQYLARRFYAPCAVVAGPKGELRVLNDTDAPGSWTVTAAFYDFAGRKLGETSRSVDVPADSVLSCGSVEPRKDGFLFLTLSDAAGRVLFSDSRFYAYYNEVDLAEAKVSAEVDGFTVTLTTDSPAFWVWANVRGIRGEFDDNAVTLLPSQPRRLTFRPLDPTVTPEDFRRNLTVTHLAELY